MEYVALLRGINVGNIRIKMPDLKKAFESAGCLEVKTYLQSGNVVFISSLPQGDLKPLLERTLTQTFAYEAYVLLYARSSLAAVVANYPFERDEGHHAYAVFVDDATVFADLAEASKGLDEPLKPADGVFYWKVVKGQTLDTPFSKLTAKAKYKKSTTTRNLNTVELML